MDSRTLEKLCREYNPDRDYNGSYGNYLAEQVYKQKESEELEQRAELENYFTFVHAVEKSGVDVDNKFRDRYEKEKLIKKYFNYKKLNGFKSLANCPDYAIGSAFEKAYGSAIKKIKEYCGEKIK